VSAWFVRGLELSDWLHHRPELDLLGDEVRGQLGGLDEELAEIGGRDALREHGGTTRLEVRSLGEVGLAPGRQNGGHAHAVRPQLGEQAAREHEQTGLRGRIHAPARPRMRGAGAADVHNEAAALLLHDRGGATASKHRSSEIAGEALSDGVIGLLAGRGDFDALACVVDQDIEATGFRDHFRHKAIPGRSVRHIGHERGRSDAVGGLSQPYHVSSRDPDACPSLHKGFRDARTVAARAAGDDDGE
jgi:hypothetical protein